MTFDFLIILYYIKTVITFPQKVILILIKGAAIDNLASEKYWENMINQSLLRFCLLKVLDESELHGYIIPEKIKEFSHGACPAPSPGTLYNTLNELEKNGYLHSRIITKGKRERKLYKLSPKGHVALEYATKAWSRTTFLIAKSCIYRQW